MTAIVPYFQRLKKEGAEGNKKIIQLTRYGTVLIAAIQAVGVASLFSSQGLAATGLSGPVFFMVTIITLVTGTVFVMWLGEQITDYGIGNGISLIITVGILAGAPKAFGDLFSQLELVEADLLDEESLRVACDNAEYIVHTASPFRIDIDAIKDENEMIEPAV